jgi:uridine kinase
LDCLWLKKGLFLANEFGKTMEIASTISACVSEGHVILIGGRSKSGKTTLAQLLYNKITLRGLSCINLSIDNWLLSASLRGGTVLGRYNLEPLRCLLESRRNSTCTNLQVVPPFYDKIMRVSLPGEQAFTIRWDDVLIIEGTISLMLGPSAGQSRQYFVETDECVRRMRVVSEYVQRGFTRNEAMELYEERMVDEVPYIDATNIGAEKISL